MHVKFATLREKHALEAWIYSLGPMHGSNESVWQKGLKGLDESHGRLGESYEDRHELDELEEQLGESVGDCHRLNELYEQLGESDEISPSCVCMRIRRVA